MWRHRAKSRGKKMWQQLTEIKTKSQSTIKCFRMLMFVTYINHFQIYDRMWRAFGRVWEWLITYARFQCEFRYQACHIFFLIRTVFFLALSTSHRPSLGNSARMNLSSNLTAHALQRRWNSDCMVCICIANWRLIFQMNWNSLIQYSHNSNGCCVCVHILFWFIINEAKCGIYWLAEASTILILIETIELIDYYLLFALCFIPLTCTHTHTSNKRRNSSAVSLIGSICG